MFVKYVKFTSYFISYKFVRKLIHLLINIVFMIDLLLWVLAVPRFLIRYRTLFLIFPPLCARPCNQC